MTTVEFLNTIVSKSRLTLKILKKIRIFVSRPKTSQCLHLFTNGPRGRGGGGVGVELLNKILYGNALPRGPTPYPL